MTGLLFKTGVGWLGSWRLRLLEIASPWLVLPLLGAIGGALSGLLVQQLAPAAAGSGIPHVMRFLSRQRVPMQLRVAVVKLVAGILAIGSGFPLGPEGPSVQMGSSVGWQMARWFKAPPSLMRVIVAAGGAPASQLCSTHRSVAFLCHRRTATASRPGAAATRVQHRLPRQLLGRSDGSGGDGQQSRGHRERRLPADQRIQPRPELRPRDLIYLVVLGAAVALLAELYSRYVVGMQRLGVRWLPDQLVLRMMIGGLLIGLVYAALPADFRNTAALQHVIADGHVEVSKAVGIFALLFFGTGLAASTGAPGGLFAPMLTLGGSIGLVAAGWAEVTTGHAPSTFVFAGMAAFIAACARSPITAVFLVFALTKNLLILKPLLVCAVASTVMASILHEQSIYKRQLKLMGTLKPVLPTH